MEQNGTKNKQKISNQQYICTVCHYSTCKKCNYDDHILRPKHIRNTNGTENKQKQAKISKQNYECECGKKYNVKSGLWKHKQKCSFDKSNNNSSQNIDKITSNMVLEILKQNNELTLKNLELTDKILKTTNNSITNTNSNNNSNNNTTTNSHNKTFNLNLFLNETCKDAMNITEFVDSIQLQLSDLENVGRLGYVNGISKIIIKNLNALDETKRPIHCTDSKREILYVKDEDIWKKDNDNDRKCVKKAIKRIAYKNCKLIPEFREKYPDCNKSESRYSDQYNKMIVEAMGGSGDNDCEKEDKIIQNISKEVQINKNSI